MKLVSFSVPTPVGAINRLGALLDGDENGRIADLNTSYVDWLDKSGDERKPREMAQLRVPPDMIGWLEGGTASFDAATQALVHARASLAKVSKPQLADGARLVFARDEVKLLAVMPRPRTLRDFSIYEEHMTRARAGAEKKPIWYTNPPYYKGNPDSFVSPGDPIPFPYYTERLDLELEIGIIVGKKGRNLTFEEAEKHIAGYTILIDPSCRDGNEREPFGPTKRKDFSNSLGPCLVTADELSDANLAVRLSVDGEVWYEGNTGHKRSFSAAQLVAYASDNETIFPGDVIGTGTVGFSCSMDHHKWIKVGQTATFWVEGIGSLSHQVIAGERVVEHVKGMKGMLGYPGPKA